jgi:hypothetical protein
MSYNNRSSSNRQRPQGGQRSDEQQWSRNSSPTNDDYEDYAGRTREIQNDSLQASSRALGKLIHASEIAQSNLAKLATQSEQLNKVDSRLEEADHHVQVSETKTTRLKALNRWFFMPAVGSKSAKRKQESLEKKELSKQEQKIRDNQQERNLESRQAPNVSSRGSSSAGRSAHIHSTPEGLERDEVEEGIDSNLNQISAGLGRLKMMGASMNSELEKQKPLLSKIQDGASVNKDKVTRLNNQMKKLGR